jgi:hypothetical protein
MEVPQQFGWVLAVLLEFFVAPVDHSSNVSSKCYLVEQQQLA